MVWGSYYKNSKSGNLLTIYFDFVNFATENVKIIMHKKKHIILVPISPCPLFYGLSGSEIPTQDDIRGVGTNYDSTLSMFRSKGTVNFCWQPFSHNKYSCDAVPEKNALALLK